MDAKRILLVDDHQLVIDGLKGFINESHKFEVVGEANNGEEAIRYAEVLNPDVILMDIDMPVLSGIQATKDIKLKHPEIKIIILSMHNERSMVKKIMSEGADGYMVKNSSQDEVLDAIQKVLDGETIFSENLLDTNHETNQKKEIGIISQLTEREIEIIELVAMGLTNKEIAEKLFISHRTVDTHRTNVMKKVNVTNVAGLIRFAFSHKLIQ
ncbi:MAG: response regulator [Putridiphycobacter sp.]